MPSTRSRHCSRTTPNSRKTIDATYPGDHTVIHRSPGDLHTACPRRRASRFACCPRRFSRRSLRPQCSTATPPTKLYLLLSKQQRRFSWKSCWIGTRSSEASRWCRTSSSPGRPCRSSPMCCSRPRSGTVRLTATDLEVGARVSVPARVVGKGAITISARKLAEIVKELPAAAGGAQGAVTTPRSASAVRGRTYKLVGLAARRFPARRAGVARRLADARGEGAARHARADQLRHLPRRDAVCTERRAVRTSGQGGPAGGHRRPSAGARGPRRSARRGRAITGIVPRKAVAGDHARAGGR